MARDLPAATCASWPFLTGTPFRLESRLSRRKQSSATRSNRNSDPALCTKVVRLPENALLARVNRSLTIESLADRRAAKGPVSLLAEADVNLQ